MPKEANRWEFDGVSTDPGVKQPSRFQGRPDQYVVNVRARGFSSRFYVEATTANEPFIELFRRSFAEGVVVRVSGDFGEEARLQLKNVVDPELISAPGAAASAPRGNGRPAAATASA